MTNLDMDRSQRGKMVLDDLEAQRGSQWLSKLKTTLCDNEKRSKSLWPDFCILKVPEYFRQPSEDFTPNGWRFGLHNCNELDMSGSQAVKISFANAFGLVGEEFDKFCDFVVEDPKSMLQCYGLQEEECVWTNEVIQKLLALDALFLAFYLSVDGAYGWWTSKQWASIKGNVLNWSRYNNYINTCGYDIYKYENQIPFKLIERAYKYLQKSRLEATDANFMHIEENVDNLYRQWAKASVEWDLKIGMSVIFENLQVDVDEAELTNAKHILGFAYKVICGVEGVQREPDYSQESYIHIPSATELKASGIKIKALPVSKGTLGDMSYESSCLSLPVMNVYDETIPFIRNMAKYEELLEGCVFHDYIFIMIDLIKTPVDLEILTKCGVLRNENSNREFNNWIGGGKHVILSSSSSIHNEMKLAINRRCKFKRYRHWNEYRHQFCSRPWYVVSALTVVAITVATLVQTYAAIIGSDGMKPRFPP